MVGFVKAQDRGGQAAWLFSAAIPVSATSLCPSTSNIIPPSVSAKSNCAPRRGGNDFPPDAQERLQRRRARYGQ
ncbi:MAG: hypothetical protein WA948_12600 [Pontixanthobacter sp.]